MTSNPFVTIWTQPRHTVRALIDEDPKRHVLLLAALGGVKQSLDRAAAHPGGKSLMGHITVVLVIGSMWGLLSLWLGSWLIELTGKWMGGMANRQALRTAIAWGSVPLVASLLIWGAQFLIFGSDLLLVPAAQRSHDPGATLMAAGLGLVDLALAFWGFVLGCNTVAEAQGYRSAWLGLGNIVFAGVILLIPILAILVVLVLVLKH